MSKRPIARLFALCATVAAAAVAITGCGGQWVFAAQAKPSHLDTVIDQMNAASAKFTSAQADLRQELFTKVVNDTAVQTGQIYFQRKGSSMQMGMKMLPPGAKPGAPPAQIVEFKDGKLLNFNPEMNHVDEVSATGKNQSLAETFLTLGFGGSGTDLKKAWTIDDQGTGQMSDGSKTVSVEKLDLVSKDPAVLKNFTHITVWIDPVRDVTLKQVFFEASGGKASGDTRTALFTNIRLNQPVDVNQFAIKCKGKCS